MSQLAANGGQPQKSPKYAPKVGEVSGKWTIGEKTGKGSFVCRCECGVEKLIGTTELIRGARSRGCRRCQIGISEDTARINELFGDYRRNAMNRDLVFSLSRREAEMLFIASCHYCGQTPSPYNGIDRKENSVGYLLSNCVSCCARCNRIKHVLGYDDFLGHLKKLLEYRGYNVTTRG